MDYFAGLNVSIKEISVCILDDTGKIVREVKVASEPAALHAVLKSPAYHFKRIGLEAGPLSQWLFSALFIADVLNQREELAWVDVRAMRNNEPLPTTLREKARRDALVQFVRAQIAKAVGELRADLTIEKAHGSNADNIVDLPQFLRKRHDAA